LELRQLKPGRNTIVFQRIADHSILAKLTTSVVAYTIGIRDTFVVSDFPRQPDSSKESADQDGSMTGTEEYEPTDLADPPEPKKIGMTPARQIVRVCKMLQFHSPRTNVQLCHSFPPATTMEIRSLEWQPSHAMKSFRMEASLASI
jgi:hypothetical protein